MEQPKATIGALPENQLMVTDDVGKISRTHCEIFKEGRRYFINDTSRNGTWLNNQRLEPGRPRVLRKGDQVSLAGQVTLIFRLK
jgi:predicted component of type VI protein secretion system